MFHCSHCDAQSLKWAGRCSQCGKWGTFGEAPDGRTVAAPAPSVHASAPTQSLKDAGQQSTTRQPSGSQEVDRVLGGGFVAGQVLLLSGEPGVGKSTLLAALASQSPGPVLYVAGEESPSQLALRFQRLGLSMEHVQVATDTRAEALCATIATLQPKLVLVDSIQTITTTEQDGSAGTPTHLRAATAQFTHTAKELHVPVILVGQITKDGAIAGPKMLEHMVDTVLTLGGDPRHAYRLLRATKHRFGSTDEVGVFEMTATGLADVASPSDLFISEETHVPGTAITCTIEGSRAFLLEIQALVNPSSYGTPVRRAHGFPTNRMQMLLAIVEKHSGVSFAGQDVYINIVGGIQAHEPAVDLAVCAALMSSAFDKALPEGIALWGEVGLGGEIRKVVQAERRTKEAQRLGMKAVLSSKNIKNVRALADKLRA